MRSFEDDENELRERTRVLLRQPGQSQVRLVGLGNLQTRLSGWLRYNRKVSSETLDIFREAVEREERLAQSLLA